MSPSRSPSPKSPRSKSPSPRGNPSPTKSPRPNTTLSPSAKTSPRPSTSGGTRVSPNKPEHKMTMAEMKKNLEHNAARRREMKQDYERAKIEKFWDKYDAYHSELAAKKEQERREREDLAELNYSFSNRPHNTVREEIR